MVKALGCGSEGQGSSTGTAKLVPMDPWARPSTPNCSRDAGALLTLCFDPQPPKDGICKERIWTRLQFYTIISTQCVWWYCQEYIFPPLHYYWDQTPMLEVEAWGVSVQRVQWGWGEVSAGVPFFLSNHCKPCPYGAHCGIERHI